jgi:hypothetical protein
MYIDTMHVYNFGVIKCMYICSERLSRRHAYMVCIGLFEQHNAYLIYHRINVNRHVDKQASSVTDLHVRVSQIETSAVDQTSNHNNGHTWYQLGLTIACEVRYLKLASRSVDKHYVSYDLKSASIDYRHVSHPLFREKDRCPQ